MSKNLNLKIPYISQELNKKLRRWNDWSRQIEKTNNLIQELKINKGDSILEIGCGEGEFLTLLGVNDFDVYGVEPRKDFIIHAQGLFSANNLSIKRIKSGKAEKLPFPDNNFDYVVSFQVLEHVKDIKKTFLEIERVLKPNGKTFHIAPNYNSFFEGHLSVPILPIMNKKMFKLYFKFIKLITIGMYKKKSWGIIDNINPIKVDCIKELNGQLKELKLSVKNWSNIYIGKGKLVIPSRSFIDPQKQSLSWRIMLFGIDVINIFGLGNVFYKLIIQKKWYPHMAIIGVKKSELF